MIGVYPNGEGGWNTGPKSENNCEWSDFSCPSDPDESDFIASIIEEIRVLGGTGNIYAYGTSNGAALAHRLASNGGTRLPIKGIIVGVTQLLASPKRSGPGSLNYNQPSSTRGTPPVSILSILGDADPVIPYKGGSAGVFGGDQAFQLMSALDSMSYWASHNGCTGSYLSSQHSTNMGDGAATKYDYTPGCPNGIYVEHYAIHGGQHNAGGAEVDGAKIDVLGFVAKVEGETPSPPSSSLPTPTPPTSGCDNDPSWSGKFSLVHTCDYVALNPETRCSFKNHEGVTANDACPGACNTSCSTPPASLSPVASPPVDTSSPVASPSPTCVRCDDLPTPWMVVNGKTCDGSEWLISDKCVVDQNWVTNGYCRSSCYTAGRGYVNEVCCPPTSGCDNDPSWSGKFSLVHTCDYVALNPETRCSFKNHEGVTANDACPGACNTSCSTPPASLSPVASPPVDTSSPVASPSPTCVRCDDLPTPWMVFNGKTCDGSEWLISDKCVVDQNWVTNGYCRSSCYTAGRGYVNEVCCPPPTPPSSCTDCSDDATPSMENNAKTCATSSIESNCYKNDWWRSNNYCQQSCYFAGYGYEGIVCCA